jgi:hypothetical protein
LFPMLLYLGLDILGGILFVHYAWLQLTDNGNSRCVAGRHRACAAKG